MSSRAVAWVRLAPPRAGVTPGWRPRRGPRRGRPPPALGGLAPAAGAALACAAPLRRLSSARGGAQARGAAAAALGAEPPQPRGAPLDLGALRRAVAQLEADPSLLDAEELGFLRRWLGRRPPAAPPPPPPAARPAAGGQASVYYPPELRGLPTGRELPEGLKVFIATPAYGGNVTVDYMTSVVNLVTQLKEVAWQLQLTAGESIITVGRNNAVMEFLATDCTHLLFLDADVAFGVETIRGLLAYDADVSLAPYPAKSLNEQRMQEAAIRRGGVPQLRDGLHYVLHAHPAKVQEALDMGSRMVEVDAGPTGCMLIRRGVFEVLQEAYPDLQCSISGSHAGRATHYDVWWRFFDTMVSDDGEFLGEDIAFCRRWRGIGGTIWADLGSTMSHVGRHAFTGNMLEGTIDYTGSGGRPT